MKVSFFSNVIAQKDKGYVECNGNLLNIYAPEIALGLLPGAARKQSVPVNQISSVSSGFQANGGRIIGGLILLFTGRANLFSPLFLVALIFLALGVIVLLNGLQDQVTITMARNTICIRISCLDKGKAEQIVELVNNAISGHMDDMNVRTNVNSATDRVVDAINNNK